MQFNPRGGTAFLTLRDPDVDMSLSVSVPMNAVNAMPIPLAQGARVVLQAKPTFWTKRGTLQALQARQIRPVGIGDLLARVEILKRTLAAEGASTRVASGRSRSCRTASDSSRAAAQPPRRTSSRTPGAAGLQSSSRSARSRSRDIGRHRGRRGAP